MDGGTATELGGTGKTLTGAAGAFLAERLGFGGEFTTGLWPCGYRHGV